MPTEFTDRVFTVVDARDAAGFAALFADDGRFVFGNSEPLVGPAEITEGLDQFFASIDDLRHEVLNEWVTGADTVTELVVTYDRLDGAVVTLPAVSIWHVADGGRIDHYRVYIDLAPLYAP